MAGKSNHKIGMWHFLRDVFVTSINKGQFPIAAVAFIIVIIILKMPSADVSKMVFSTFESIADLSMVGYGLCLVMAVTWVLSAKHYRRMHYDELKRVSDERNEWQEKALGIKIQSSNKP